MKYLLLLTAALFCINSYAQTITGMVTDKTTREPLNGTVVKLGSQKTRTNILGRFEISATGINDSLKVSHFAYKPVTLSIAKSSGVLHIELEPMVIRLNTVNINGNRDFKQDSIANRTDYAKQFNYTGPKVLDAFAGNPNKGYGELISINPLLLIAALTKKSTPEYKFRQILVRDEQVEFVDHKFNRGIVGPLTGLKGDTLSNFLVRYRPGFQFAKKASDYEMINYIKDCYKEFEKEGFKGRALF